MKYTFLQKDINLITKYLLAKAANFSRNLDCHVLRTLVPGKVSTLFYRLRKKYLAFYATDPGKKYPDFS